MLVHPQPGFGSFELAEPIGQVVGYVYTKKDYNGRRAVCPLFSCRKYATFDFFLLKLLFYSHSLDVSKPS